MVEENFNNLYKQLKTPLKAKIYSMLRDPVRSEEVYQETFLKAWEKRNTYKESGSIKGWIFRIAVNLCLDELRRRNRAPLNQSSFTGNEDDEETWDSFLEKNAENPFPLPEQQTLDNEMIQALHQAFGGLEKDKKELIDLIYIREYSLKKAARSLGIPYGTAKSRMHYTLKKLANLFKSIYSLEDD